MEKLIKKVLRKIEPSKAEIKKQEKFISWVTEKYPVIVAGSVSRGTHLRKDNDIDIFLMLPETLSLEEFRKEGLRLGKKIIGKNWKIEYAQHPYVKGEKDGFDLEVIPSYAISDSEKIKSAVDRSPFHSKYMMEKLDDRLRGEIRVFKKFLKGIGVYGAEIKTHGIPGYLAELIVLKYGGFKESIEKISKWEKGVKIDIGNKGKKEFSDCLVAIDPTDGNRNVAASFSEENFYRLIAACRMFLEKPSEKFFFPRKVKVFGVEKLRKKLEEKEIFGIRIPCAKEVPDIIWGQIYRFESKIENLLKENDFEVVRSKSFHCECSAVIVYELKSLVLQLTKYKVGPKAQDLENAIRFFQRNKIVSGPRIKDGKWVAEVYRKEVNSLSLVREYLRKGKEKKPLGKYLQRGSVMNEENLIDFFKKNSEFQVFLSEYLDGREPWMR